MEIMCEHCGMHPGKVVPLGGLNHWWCDACEEREAIQWSNRPEEDGTPQRCDHRFDWDGGKNVGRCLTEYSCKKCGMKRTVDSGD